MLGGVYLRLDVELVVLLLLLGVLDGVFLVGATVFGVRGGEDFTAGFVGAV